MAAAGIPSAWAVAAEQPDVVDLAFACDGDDASWVDVVALSSSERSRRTWDASLRQAVVEVVVSMMDPSHLFGAEVYQSDAAAAKIAAGAATLAIDWVGAVVVPYQWDVPRVVADLEDPSCAT